MTNQQENNTTLPDMVHDIRTPPKIKQQVQKMKIKNEVENSHAGVAIPIDEDSLEMEETTKKLNFYKIERPTTNSGLSTWILLSGQASDTTTKSPSTKKTVVKPTSEVKPQNVTLVSNDKPIRTVKPIFKQRPTTTHKPITTETTTTTVKSTTTKLTKVKASVLNSSNKKLNATVESTTRKQPVTTSVTTAKPISSTHATVKKNETTETTTRSVLDSSALPVESKNGEADLPNTDNKKKKTTAKRKKNKTKRRKPGDKNSNSTSVSKPTKIFKNKPIGTQLYNYLAREIMPTVGVGLVGLMVTAGLASYFLYPFGAARRSYEIDRKDKEDSYYYSDDYSGGMPEEEAIGKVIAGMPGNSLYENSYKSPTSRNAFLNTKYRLTDRRSQIQRNPYGGMVQGTVENVPLTSAQLDKEITYEKPNYQSNVYEPVSYSSDLDTRYSATADKKFVVGNIPKEVVAEVTPAAVPEHGPRKLNFEENYAEEPIFIVGSQSREFTRDVKIGALPAQRPRSLKVRRKRSDIPNDIDNEIVPSLDKEEVTTDVTTSNNLDETKTTTTIIPNSTASSNTTEKNETATVDTQTTPGLPEKINSFIDLMRELIHYKARLGLQMIQNATISISKYISKVQTRLDQHYRTYSKNKH